VQLSYASNKELLTVTKDQVAGFRIYRSPVQVKYCNVVAVDSQGKLLVVVSSDLTFDEASLMVDMLNEEYNFKETTV
jgi:nitrate reductase NapAB chaperone NapD